MKTLLILLVLLFISSTAYSSSGMRRCALLPIKDNTSGGELSFEVFKKVERNLKDSDWCYYKSNSEILNLLENHRKSIQQYLNNPNVVKIIAEKLNVGSLIKIDLDNYLGGVKLELKIIGENGKDLYFKETATLKRIDIDLIAEQINLWLALYEKNIPYNARVTGVLGNQFTLSGGKSFGFRRQHEITIIRPVKKKKHPLLKEIIDWETIKIGSAKVYNVTDSTSQARVLQYDTRKRIKIGDWIIISENQKSVVTERKSYNKKNDFKFGKLGVASIYFQTSFFDTITNSSSTKKLSGTKLGVNLKSDIWITRKVYGGFNFVKSFSSMKPKLGTFTQTSQNISNSDFQLYAGYKYLPLGFFYGPQINAYLGYSSYTYGFDTQVSDGLTNFTFSGLLLGLNGDIPFMKRFRGRVGVELIFSPSFSQEITVLDSKDSNSSTKFTIEAIYKYKVNLDFNFKYESVVNRALLNGTTSSIDFKDSVLNFGASFTF